MPNQELLLEAAHALRVEKDRQKELESQLEQQMLDIQRSETVRIYFHHRFIISSFFFCYSFLIFQFEF